MWPIYKTEFHPQARPCTVFPEFPVSQPPQASGSVMKRKHFSIIAHPFQLRSVESSYPHEPWSGQLILIRNKGSDLLLISEQTAFSFLH